MATQSAQGSGSSTVTTPGKRRSQKRQAAPIAEGAPPAKAPALPKAQAQAQKRSVGEIFDTLEYGPAPESASAVNEWLDDHGRAFGHFINGKWHKPAGRATYDTFNPATGQKLASTMQGTQEDIDLAVGAARKAFESWSKTPGMMRDLRQVLLSDSYYAKNLAFARFCA